MKKEAEETKNDSTDLFTAADKLKVPLVDTDAMIDDANKIINETETLQPGVNILICKL